MNNKISEKRIDKEEVREATKILNDYKNCKTNLEKRIIENDKWWKMQHWGLIKKNNSTDPEPASAWLFNCIANKHADAMDSFPEPCILPREESDKKSAETLSKIIPVLLEYNDFEAVYSDAWWYKLKTGTACYGIFWNNSKENGLGDIDIRQLDILNMFWESGIKDIQESRNIFTVELADNDILIGNYPFLNGKLSSSGIDVASYIYDDNVDTTNKSAVVDWYYKKNIDGKEVVHYCKFVGEDVLYSSENDPALYKRGFYDHGKYPFVFDVLFSDEGTPCGFGYIDVMKDVQMYIDKLNQIILKNALQSGRRRFFISDNSGINEEEFADWSREFVHTTGPLDDRNIKEINVSQLDGSVMNLLNQKIEELKETSGTRDVSYGGIAKGVTAASAIAALQEAGSKLSRDMIKTSYRAFRHINYFIIELIRQFYNEPRCFRICGNSFEYYTNDAIKEKVSESSLAGMEYIRKPIFDISVTSQKSNPFSVTAQNELAKELYSLGLFNPDMAGEAVMCLEMMNFEGKEKIIEKIRSRSYLNHANEGTRFIPDGENGASEDESYLVKAFKNTFPGQTTLKEARRSARI
ncbi:MAG: hypothetical protein IJN40_03335 [Clostridia bacterium]|nr:hypothetical protein [Clostridia bacterium]